jgi:predicted alpha-1,2-mannosidase
MLGHYKETGLLPVWELMGNETGTMIGYHAIPVIADAILKGFNGFDISLAYEAMKKSAMQDKLGLNYWKELGYIPSDKENESVSKGLEYAYDDWCIAQIAGYLDKDEDYKYFLSRSNNYKNFFDSALKFMRGKDSDGKWKEPFNPRYSNHRDDIFTEGNAWQYSWFAPHDIPGLINLMGGKAIFEEKLDSLFTIDSKIEGENASSDISGLIGQYAHGNEPSHHIAYLYNYCETPWKTQRMINKIITTLYNDKPDGLSGNEDCGQMSAWYVFSALGFYPVNPANQKYSIGTPLFDKAEIALPNGKIFTIIADRKSKENIYIQSIELNGKPIDDYSIDHDEILAGGILKFVMGNSPKH